MMRKVVNLTGNAPTTRLWAEILNSHCTSEWELQWHTDSTDENEICHNKPYPDDQDMLYFINATCHVRDKAKRA